MTNEKSPSRLRSFLIGILLTGLFFAVLSVRSNPSPQLGTSRGISSSPKERASGNEPRIELSLGGGPASPSRPSLGAVSALSVQAFAPLPASDGMSGVNDSNSFRMSRRDDGQAEVPGALSSAGQGVSGAAGSGLLTVALAAAVCVCLLLLFALARTTRAYRAESERMRSDKLRLELSEERYRLMARNSDVVIFELNFADRTLEASENFERFLGECPDLDGFLNCDRLHPEDRGEFDRLLRETGDNRDNVTGELRLLGKNNKYVWFSVLLSSFADKQGKVARVIGKLTNIDREKREKALLELCAKTDMMTGLFNKAATERMISISLSENPGQTSALLILDIDNLKSINDTLGHAEGDRAIMEVASTLKKHFRSTDIIGRVGGDEFMAFLRNIGSESKLHNSIFSLVQRLSRIRFGEDGGIQLHGSVGAVVNSGSDTFETLYKKADKALYYVKRNGKNDYAFYSHEMELGDYQFTGNAPVSSVRSELFDAEELDQLLNAIAVYFTIVIFVSLTKNCYYIIGYCGYEGGFPNDSGSYEHLVYEIGNSFYPECKEAFFAAFSREALLFAHEHGEKSAAFEGSRPVGQGDSLKTLTTAVFVEPGRDGDVCAILLMHES